MLQYVPLNSRSLRRIRRRSQFSSYDGQFLGVFRLNRLVQRIQANLSFAHRSLVLVFKPNLSLKSCESRDLKSTARGLTYFDSKANSELVFFTSRRACSPLSMSLRVISSTMTSELPFLIFSSPSIQLTLLANSQGHRNSRDAQTRSCRCHSQSGGDRCNHG